MIWGEKTIYNTMKNLPKTELNKKIEEVEKI